MLAEVTSIPKANIALDSDATCNLLMKKCNMGLEIYFFSTEKNMGGKCKSPLEVANEFK